MVVVGNDFAVNVVGFEYVSYVFGQTFSVGNVSGMDLG